MVGPATGVAMIARGEILISAGRRQAAYNTAGSLKWVHGVTLYAILELPALALLLTFLGWAQERRTRAIFAATDLYAIATVAVLVISLGR